MNNSHELVATKNILANKCQSKMHTTSYPLWMGKGPITNDQNTQNNDIIGYTRLTPFFWDTLETTLGEDEEACFVLYYCGNSLLSLLIKCV
jgi:hypothetical protein